MLTARFANTNQIGLPEYSFAAEKLIKKTVWRYIFQEFEEVDAILALDKTDL
ncbi:hypothetical protein [Cylindrospermum sp. FACHB-282]|uniref:hypothetical protein n=1 Tax=Cylindrospermum sp. FACHB-282 TaxID=2692794 RepID=UPI0016878076|nr:hypothetical protein [Cylindrospermum sp. FACHB-282]MBD2384953.1 hypothetical protein [Cylindrospermum sp. FACHB-282]